MKKLFTLALVLLVATAGYSQVRSMSKNDIKKNDAAMFSTKGMESFENVQSEPNMTRSEGELDYTYYDWQTNHGFINRTVVWPDGKVNFAYTMATDGNFSDRGTGIGTYDSNADEWIPLGGRIESERTGFGSIARYKENGLVVAAHTSDNLNVYIVEDKDNMSPGSVASSLNIGTDVWSHPCVATSGAEHSIIHVVAAVFSGEEGGVTGAIRYWRSSDGETWDKTCVELPYLSAEYGTEHGTNSYYWMDLTEDNCLGLVINTGYTDGIVLYTMDNGETWERKIYFHDPAPGVELEESFCYPRWTSAVWNSNKEVMMAYEFNFSDHQGHYGPATGGVAFWSEYMPYHGESLPQWGVDPGNPLPPTPGNPFIMDSSYIYQDIYSSAWFWSDASHDMWPEYFGYLPALTDQGFWEDPYQATEWNISLNSDMHGPYNSGVCAFPILCKLEGSDYDLVTVWSALDENSDPGNTTSTYLYKLFAAYSGDGGLTWQHQVPLLAGNFEFEYSEMVWPQAAVLGTTLVVAAQMDAGQGTFVQQDDMDGGDNYYQGLTFELADLFPGAGVGVPEVSHNTHMSIYPNPAVEQLNVTLSQNANIAIYNIMGQNVMNVEGHAGANSININSLNAGVYFISAGSDTQKFIVK